MREDGDGGYVDDGSLISFVADVSGQARQDVLDSCLLAQLGANAVAPREEEVEKWYQKYKEVLGHCGWTISGQGFDTWDSGTASFKVDKIIFEVLAALLTQNELAVATKTLDALTKLGEDDEKVRIFETKSSSSHGGNFQIGVCNQTNDSVAMRLGAFYYSVSQSVTNFLWFEFSSSDAHFWQGKRQATLNDRAYAVVRDQIITKLDVRRGQYIRDLEI
ncbi:hypothetical protein B4N89_35935 [Embleya scabrispora]|uniref:Uncharacterized protein n=1 Tax=Embleya scabrispora TaxID=159449 RepID=A0A1T3NLZ1_9ACTN|nr:hypothetical protein B4N89_35935 [Embleya scabrispora]